MINKANMFSSQKAVHEIQLIEHDFVLSIEDAAGAFSKASNPPPPPFPGPRSE